MDGAVVLKLDRDAKRFRALASPYKGSFFGIVGTSAGVLAYGMRGSAFLSEDEGSSWQPVSSGLTASIVASAVDADGTLALVDQGGGIAVSGDGGRNFASAPVRSPMALAAVAFGAKTQLVVGGPAGVRTLELTSKDK